MEKKHVLLLIFSFFVPNRIAGANDDCLPACCSSSDPEIRFPFRILGQQPDRCVFPGFDLSCDGQNQTILQLSSSLSYIVNSISYLEQVIYIDPEFCRPNRIVGVNVTDTPFSYSNFFMQSYTFYNCSQNYSSMYPDVPFPCLSSGNHSVIAMLPGSVYPGYVPPNCKVMKSVVLPVRPNGDISVALELMWFTPYCKTCEREGKACALKTDDVQTICVSSSRGKGISSSAKYGLSIGMSVLALICISGIACYVSSKVQGHNDSHDQSIDNSPVANIPQLPDSGTGLDGHTMESYPKTVFGESSQSPNVDATCVICLFDYKLKESLMTIPQCNHCFHAECIDEWLKLNKTCPVCRNTP